MTELTKSQKKIARALIDRTLERECTTFLKQVNSALQHQDPAETNHQRYLKLYQSMIRSINISAGNMTI